MLRNADAQQNPHFRPSLARSSPEIRAMTQPAPPPCRVTARGFGRWLRRVRIFIEQDRRRRSEGGQRPPEKDPQGPLGSNRQSFHPAVSKSALNRREMRADQNWPRGFGTLTGIRSSTFWQGRTCGTGPRCWRSWPGIGGSGWLPEVALRLPKPAEDYRPFPVG